MAYTGQPPKVPPRSLAKWPCNHGAAQLLRTTPVLLLTKPPVEMQTPLGLLLTLRMAAANSPTLRMLRFPWIGKSPLGPIPANRAPLPPMSTTTELVMSAIMT